MHTLRKILVILLACVGVIGILVSPYVEGSEMQATFGYSVGDSYTFTDSIIETTKVNQTNLREDISHQFGIRITAIDEAVGGYTIRLTTEILNLSAGLTHLNHSNVMEGHTSIVSGPRVYFTHTLWSVHSFEFISDADDYQSATQMSGTVEENADLHLYYWNLSREISETISIYDMNQDGQTDAYTSISGYLAHFSEQGVLLRREFITEFRFANGANYYRLRQISLTTGPLPPSPILTPETGVILGVIVTVTLSLSILTLYWYRRSLNPHE